MSAALAERTKSVKKYTDEFMKCNSCLYGNNFEIEIKKDNEGNYYYAEKCPRCSHFEEFKVVTKREASKYLLLEDLA